MVLFQFQSAIWPGPPPYYSSNYTLKANIQLISYDFYGYLTIFMSLSQLISKLDYNQVQISRTRTYSTSLGKIVGLLIGAALLFAFFYKLMALVNKDIIYLNTVVSNDRSAVNFSDFYFFLGLFGDISINVQNQFQYGINVTMSELITQRKQTNFLEFVQGLSKDCKSLKGCEKIPSSYIFNKRKFQMTACQENSNTFCTPKQFRHNMTLQGDSKFLDNKVVTYFIEVSPCDISHLQCKRTEDVGYAYFIGHRIRKIDVEERNTNDMIKDIQDNTGRIGFLDDDYYDDLTYKLMQINITTFQSSFIPSFIPAFLIPKSANNKNLKQSWFYNGQEIYKQIQRRSKDWQYLIISFQRSNGSSNYERRFVNIDNVIAQVFGLSAFAALVIKCCLNGYARWEADSQIVAKIQNDHHYKGSFLSYLKKKLFCCKEENMIQLQKERILQKANKSIDIIDSSKKLRQLQEKLVRVELLLSERYFQKYQDEKQKQSNDNCEGLNQSLHQNLIKSQI